jgi:transcription-repair coupling factor (superfamily II helicase)
VAAAYTRTDLVERRGEFAVRGGILDVFPPTEEHPLRVEFWGDTVEEIRWFRVADQRSSRWPSTGCGRRRAASCCSPTRCASGPATWPTSCPASPTCSRRSPRASPSRAWSRCCPALVDGMRRCSTCCPRGRWSSPTTPSGSAARPRPGRDERGVPRGRAGPTRPASAATSCPSTCARARHGSYPDPRRPARPGPRPRYAVVDLTSFATDEERRRRLVLDLGLRLAQLSAVTPTLPCRPARPGGRQGLDGPRRHRGPGPGQAGRRGARRARRQPRLRAVTPAAARQPASSS